MDRCRTACLSGRSVCTVGYASPKPPTAARSPVPAILFRSPPTIASTAISSSDLPSHGYPAHLLLPVLLCGVGYGPMAAAIHDAGGGQGRGWNFFHVWHTCDAIASGQVVAKCGERWDARGRDHLPGQGRGGGGRGGGGEEGAPRDTPHSRYKRNGSAIMEAGGEAEESGGIPFRG